MHSLMADQDEIDGRRHFFYLLVCGKKNSVEVLNQSVILAKISSSLSLVVLKVLRGGECKTSISLSYVYSIGTRPVWDKRQGFIRKPLYI